MVAPLGNNHTKGIACPFAVPVPATCPQPGVLPPGFRCEVSMACRIAGGGNGFRTDHRTSQLQNVHHRLLAGDKWRGDALLRGSEPPTARVARPCLGT